MNKKLFLFFLLSLPGVGCLARQETVSRDSARVEFYFRQGYATLSPSFRNNGVRFDSLLHHVVQLCKDSTCHVRLIRIVSGASPEGASGINRNLSDRRGMAVGTYLKERLAPDTCFFEMESKGVDWIGLAGLVAVSDMPHR